MKFKFNMLKCEIWQQQLVLGSHWAPFTWWVLKGFGKQARLQTQQFLDEQVPNTYKVVSKMVNQMGCLIHMDNIVSHHAFWTPLYDIMQFKPLCMTSQNPNPFGRDKKSMSKWREMAMKWMVTWIAEGDKNQKPRPTVDWIAIQWRMSMLELEITQTIIFEIWATMELIDLRSTK